MSRHTPVIDPHWRGRYFPGHPFAEFCLQWITGCWCNLRKSPWERNARRVGRLSANIWVITWSVITLSEKSERSAEAACKNKPWHWTPAWPQLFVRVPHTRHINTPRVQRVVWETRGGAPFYRCTFCGRATVRKGSQWSIVLWLTWCPWQCRHGSSFVSIHSSTHFFMY